MYAENVKVRVLGREWVVCQSPRLWIQKEYEGGRGRETELFLEIKKKKDIFYS